MNRMTNYFALMILFYLLYFGGKGLFDVIVGNTENVWESLGYALLSITAAVMYYFFIYRPYKGK